MLRAILLALAFCVGTLASASAADAPKGVTGAAAAKTSIENESKGVFWVHHKVADYAKWRAVFDSEEAAAERKAAGLKRPRVLRSETDPNDIFIQASFTDIAKVKAFAASDELKARMKAAGVVGAPEVLFLVRAE